MKKDLEEHKQEVLNCEHEFHKESDEEGGFYNFCDKCDESEYWIKQFNEEAKNKKLGDFK